MVSESSETLSLDQYFTDGRIYYFIEQKVRDDHDSAKKQGQISNSETKLKILHKKHGPELFGVMYFIDPDLTKNKNHYLQELKKLEEFYGVKLSLFYGKELFDYLQEPFQSGDNRAVFRHVVGGAPAGASHVVALSHLLGPAVGHPAVARRAARIRRLAEAVAIGDYIAHTIPGS